MHTYVFNMLITLVTLPREEVRCWDSERRRAKPGACSLALSRGLSLALAGLEAVSSCTYI